MVRNKFCFLGSSVTATAGKCLEGIMEKCYSIF